MRVANLSVSCTRRMEDVAHHALAQLLLPLHPAGRAALGPCAACPRHSTLALARSASHRSEDLTHRYQAGRFGGASSECSSATAGTAPLAAAAMLLPLPLCGISWAKGPWAVESAAWVLKRR